MLPPLGCCALTYPYYAAKAFMWLNNKLDWELIQLKTYRKKKRKIVLTWISCWLQVSVQLYRCLCWHKGWCRGQNKGQKDHTAGNWKLWNATVEDHPWVPCVCRSNLWFLCLILVCNYRHQQTESKAWHCCQNSYLSLLCPNETILFQYNFSCKEFTGISWFRSI